MISETGGKLFELKVVDFKPKSMLNHSIIRTEGEAYSGIYYIVTEDFKTKCEEAHLKGLLFVPEGDPRIVEF